MAPLRTTLALILLAGCADAPTVVDGRTPVAAVELVATGEACVTAWEPRDEGLIFSWGPGALPDAPQVVGHEAGHRIWRACAAVTGGAVEVTVRGVAAERGVTLALSADAVADLLLCDAADLSFPECPAER